MNALELTGRARSHLVELSDMHCALHAQAAPAFLAMRREAARASLDLIAVSGFRDFERQLAIWNAKYSGTRPVQDADGLAVDVSILEPAERILAILRWSALPGASRHHWGTDVDLIDRGALPAGYRVRLIPEEYAPGGPFAPAAAWLDANASRFGFFRPYRGVRSAVQPEPWHFSFAPIAEPARRRLGVALLRDALGAAALLGKEHVLERLDELHSRYVATVDLP